MSALTNALYEMIAAAVHHAAAERMGVPPRERGDADQRLARAGEAYESALAQFTADVARHAVT